jgi:hypothetical protein
MDDEYFLPFSLRCEVFLFLVRNFEDQRGSGYLQHYLYQTWPKKSTLLHLPPDVKTRNKYAVQDFETSPGYSDLVLTDEDCVNVGLHLLGDAFLSRLWRYGASDEILAECLVGIKEVENYRCLDFFQKFRKLGLSESVKQKYASLADERVKVESIFPKEGIFRRVLTFALSDYDTFISSAKIAGFNLIELKFEPGQTLLLKFRAALRMDADILLLPQGTEVGEEESQVLATTLETRHALALFEPCNDQIEKVKAAINNLMNGLGDQLKIFSLPAIH